MIIWCWSCERLSLGFAHSISQTVDQTGIASEQDGFMGAENEGDDYETIYTLQRSKKGMIIIVLVVVNE